MPDRRCRSLYAKRASLATLTVALALPVLALLLWVPAVRAVSPGDRISRGWAPSMSTRRAARELSYLDRGYARTRPDLVSWHVADCRRRSRTSDNCAERDVWAAGSNGIVAPNACVTRVSLQTTTQRMVEFFYGTTVCVSLDRSSPQRVVFGAPPHPTALVTQPFGVVGRLRSRRA